MDYVRGDDMTQLDLTAIGIRLKEQRKALGLTQQEIYEKIDISQNHYSRIENGHVGMSIEILVQLSEILNLSIDYILTGKLRTDNRPAFIEEYNSLSEKQKKYIHHQIDGLRKFDLK